MTRKMIWTFLIGTLVSHGVQAQQPQFDVQELYDQCKQKSDTQASTFCLGFIAGIADVMRHNGDRRSSMDAAQWAAVSELALCGGPSYGAYIQAFMNWAQKHPEYWGERNFQGVVAALHQAWPCPGISN